MGVGVGLGVGLAVGVGRGVGLRVGRGVGLGDGVGLAVGVGVATGALATFRSSTNNDPATIKSTAAVRMMMRWGVVIRLSMARMKRHSVPLRNRTAGVTGAGGVRVQA